MASIVILIAFCTHLNSISTTDNFVSDNINVQDDFSRPNVDTDNVQHYTSSDVSARSKRSRAESSKHRSRVDKRPKYSSKSTPLALKINDETVNFLSGIEKKLIAKGDFSVWENFENITEEYATDLCTEAWKMELQEMPEIKVKVGMTPDCGPNLIAGPSNPNDKFVRYKGYIQYFVNMKGSEFIPDLIRCNCAIVKLIRGAATKAARNSRRFFYLHKLSGNSYIILIPDGAPGTRDVKVANLREIVIY